MPYKDAEQRTRYAREWVARRRAEFFAGKSCEWCGAVATLELHHRDPNQKEAHAIWSWSAARRLAEIAKCIVLCRPCHSRAHAEARRVEAELRNPHGTPQRYDLGCRCSSCRRGHADQSRAYNRQKVAA